MKDLNQYLAHRADLVRRLKQVLIERLHVPRAEDEIEPDAPLFGTGLALDSVDAVELVVSLEAEFGVRVDDGGSSRRAMRSVNSLVDLVLRQTGAEHVAG